MEKNNMFGEKNLNLKVPQELFNRIDAKAKEKYTTRSAYIRTLLVKGLENE